MAGQWVKSKSVGVRYRQHPSRKHGVNFDRYFTIRYKVHGKEKSEGLGWASEGWTEKKAAAVLAELKANQTTGQGPATLAEKRKIKQQQEEAKAEQERQQANRWTLEKLWNEYRQQLPGGDASKADMSRWNLYLNSFFAHKEPLELARLDIDRVRITLLKKKSPQTVKHVLALLRRIVNFGVDRGLIAPLPYKIALPSVDNVKTEDLAPEQLQQLFEVLKTTPFQTAANMMRLALFTGMRRGEMFKLRWSDLDFHRGFIFIREPKGGKSQKIPMNMNARALMQSIPATDSDYCFPARDGGPRKDISKDLRAIKKAAELPDDFRALHGLRHVYATMLASSGQVDMFTLQKLLTHKSPEMTQRYAHYRDEAMQRAAEQVNDILSAALETPLQKTDQE